MIYLCETVTVTKFHLKMRYHSNLTHPYLLLNDVMLDRLIVLLALSFPAVTEQLDIPVGSCSSTSFHAHISSLLTPNPLYFSNIYTFDENVNFNLNFWWRLLCFHFCFLGEDSSSKCNLFPVLFNSIFICLPLQSFSFVQMFTERIEKAVILEKNVWFKWVCPALKSKILALIDKKTQGSWTLIWSCLVVWTNGSFTCGNWHHGSQNQQHKIKRKRVIKR